MWGGGSVVRDRITTDTYIYVTFKSQDYPSATPWLHVLMNVLICILCCFSPCISIVTLLAEGKYSIRDVTFILLFPNHTKMKMSTCSVALFKQFAHYIKKLGTV